ncbi:hypothetical protein RIF29_04236 [Crotalaria pallida]|uniref:Uncharacterized protein n=1 Tax=Crotalaria pallida TaxID=3830 RepID=A0AAN9P943_CROPI
MSASYYSTSELDRATHNEKLIEGDRIEGEQFFNEEEVSDSSRAFAEEQPFKQRLLVVANRLLVSAIREGVDSYDLEEFDTRWIGEGGM